MASHHIGADKKNCQFAIGYSLSSQYVQKYRVNVKALLP